MRAEKSNRTTGLETRFRGRSCRYTIWDNFKNISWSPVSFHVAMEQIKKSQKCKPHAPGILDRLKQTLQVFEKISNSIWTHVWAQYLLTSSLALPCSASRTARRVSSCCVRCLSSELLRPSDTSFPLRERTCCCSSSSLCSNSFLFKGAVMWGHEIQP